MKGLAGLFGKGGKNNANFSKSNNFSNSFGKKGGFFNNAGSNTFNFFQTQSKFASFNIFEGNTPQLITNSMIKSSNFRLFSILNIEKKKHKLNTCIKLVLQNQLEKAPHYSDY